MGNDNGRFAKLYARYGGAVYRLAISYLASEPDREDVMQEVFERLLARAPAFANEAHEKRWLLRWEMGKVEHLGAEALFQPGETVYWSPMANGSLCPGAELLFQQGDARAAIRLTAVEDGSRYTAERQP